MFKSNYQKSNAITLVRIKPTSEDKNLVQSLLRLKSVDKRQELSQALLDSLSRLVKIESVRLKVSATKQYHRRWGGRVVAKQYGVYRPQLRYIYIQNQTAVRGQNLAAKTFLDTLLHEWLHHYDCYKLRLNSIHTKGFYLRLKDLKKKLEA